jgi:hypothetical protein
MNTLRAIARLQKKEIFMADGYKTSDGQVYSKYDLSNAVDHQRSLDGVPRVSNVPGPTNNFSMKIDNLYRNGDYKGVVNETELNHELITKHGLRYNFIEMIGKSYFEVGNFGNAISYLSVTAKNDESKYIVYVMLSLLHMKKWAKAIRH